MAKLLAGETKQPPASSSWKGIILLVSAAISGSLTIIAFFSPGEPLIYVFIDYGRTALGNSAVWRWFWTGSKAVPAIVAGTVSGAKTIAVTAAPSPHSWFWWGFALASYGITVLAAIIYFRIAEESVVVLFRFAMKRQEWSDRKIATAAKRGFKYQVSQLIGIAVATGVEAMAKRFATREGKSAPIKLAAMKLMVAVPLCWVLGLITGIPGFVLFSFALTLIIIKAAWSEFDGEIKMGAEIIGWIFAVILCAIIFRALFVPFGVPIGVWAANGGMLGLWAHGATNIYVYRVLVFWLIALFATIAIFWGDPPIVKVAGGAVVAIAVLLALGHAIFTNPNPDITAKTIITVPTGKTSPEGSPFAAKKSVQPPIYRSAQTVRPAIQSVQIGAATAAPLTSTSVVEISNKPCPQYAGSKLDFSGSTQTEIDLTDYPDNCFGPVVVIPRAWNGHWCARAMSISSKGGDQPWTIAYQNTYLSGDTMMPGKVYGVYRLNQAYDIPNFHAFRLRGEHLVGAGLVLSSYFPRSTSRCESATGSGT